MACDDRQLTEAQRQAGYQNQRTGVVRAVRPFSGSPTLPNLLDYINRELYPAVQATRNKVNDVYLQTTDNAPSGNPLTYYFSTETANADPTTGRIRLDQAVQDTATTIRVSQTNGRLVDVAPWLDVMAGSSTTPLGVVTLTDAINPGRFLRFDLNTMTDQGTYWDLGVSIIESSHDNPFVDDGPIAIGFMPGVASTGTTVPPGALTPIAANTVLGNPTTSTAAPVAIAIAENSVLGRAGAAGTGNIESITVPGTGTLTGEVVFLQSSSLRNHVRFSNFALNALPLMDNNKFIGNVSGATARPTYTDLAQLAQDLFGIGFDETFHSFKLSDALDNTFIGNISGATGTPTATSLGLLSSTSILYENVGKTFIREALTGDVTAAQNSNTVTVNANAITDATLRDSGPLSVIGRSANTTGDPADISAVAASGAVLRESGSVLGFGQVATAGIADSAVTNAKLANMVAGTYKGRLVTAGTGVPTDLTGSEAAGGLRFDGGTIVDTLSPGTITSYAPTGFTAATTGVRISPPANVVLRGMALSAGQQFTLRVGRGSTAVTVTINHEDASAAAVGERFNTPNNVALVLRAGEAALIRNTESRNNVIAVGRSSVSDADYGDITVSSNGSVWTIDNDVVTDAKLRNSGALSVIGRSANSSGDPADISATAASGAVLRESGSVLGFGTVATAGLTDDAVTNGKLRDSGALSVIGRSANSSGDPADISAVAASGAVLRESGSVLGFGTIATAGVADNAITDAKLRQSAGLSVIGRSANTTGNVADITAANDAEVLRRSGTTLGFGTVATAGIADDAVTNPKLANMAEGTVKGRAIAAGTGDPTDLTGQQAAGLLRYAPIIDTTSSGTVTTYAPTGFDAATTNIRVSPTANLTLRGMALANGQCLSIRVGRGSTFTVTLNHEDASAAALSERFNCPNNVALVLRAGEGCILRAGESRNNVVAVGKAGIADADYGDITVTTGGTVMTIDNDVVTDAKLRNSAAVSVIGRSANSAGDPADIAAAANDRLLARTSDSLAFQQLTDGMVPTNTIALTKLANILDNRVLGNVSGATGAVTAIDLASFNSTSIIYETTGKTFIRQALTGEVTAAQNSNATTITNGAVTNAKLRNSDSLSVIGNPTNAATVPSDITATVDGHVLRRSGTTLGFGTVATAGIADAAVTLAKQADLAQSRIIGRAEGAGTGVPTALTPTQVVAVIDGENATWTGAHSFTGASHTVNVSGTVSVTAGSTVTTTAGTQNILAAGTTIDLNSPTRLQSSIATTAVQNNSSTAANDLTLSSVGAVRFSGPPNPLTGMIATTNGQIVLLANVHATDDMVIQLESPSSSAANRFAGSVTDRHIKPGEMALAWYDGTSSRWRLLCRDDVDL